MPSGRRGSSRQPSLARAVGGVQLPMRHQIAEIAQGGRAGWFAAAMAGYPASAWQQQAGPM
jgi:hypothetical protein